MPPADVNLMRQKCTVPMILAYLAAAYVSASIAYLVFTSGFGTPFKNSLSPVQREIKRRSASRRGTVFSVSFLAFLGIFLIWKPFKACE